MKKITVLLFALLVVASANPIMVKVINEFQIAPDDSERIELKYFQTPTLDTLFDPLDLYGAHVITPAGTASIDTHLILPGNGFAVIDTSVLNGPFGLPDSTGFLKVSHGWLDTVIYPSQVPAPPPTYSTAFYYCYAYDPYEGYIFYGDWYPDASPTFGGPNDDYPGCVINGHVYDASAQPITGAQIVVNASTGALPQPPFYKCCTTYTALDGSYVIDSLLPFFYWVKVAGSSYFPDSCFTSQLKCLVPTTVNFYLTSVDENRDAMTRDNISITPNPFRTTTNISIESPGGDPERSFRTSGHSAKGMELKIYDAAGRLVKSFTLRNTPCAVCWNGTDQEGKELPEGVYFCKLVTDGKTFMEKLVILK
jgi:hypothetical protein